MTNREVEKSKYLKVRTVDGSKFINFLKHYYKGKSIVDPKRKVLHEEKFIFFPLDERGEESLNFLQELKEIVSYQIVARKSIENPNYVFKTLKEGIKELIPLEYLEFVPNSYDIIGNIIVIEYDRIDQLPEQEREFFKEHIAKKLIEKHKNVKTVYEKVGKVDGRYRLRELKLIWGKANSETIYRENDCLFKLDIKKTYFSPRLNHERKRVASQEFRKNELIVDMFAGVGPFSIQIAREHDVIIHAFDINPQAFNYLVENINLNTLTGQVIPYNLNIKDLPKNTSEIGQKLRNKVDRIIMNLPESSLDFIDVACFLIKEEGILYNYQICEKPQSIKKSLLALENALKKNQRNIMKVLNTRIVKQYSPKADLIALDVRINSN